LENDLENNMGTVEQLAEYVLEGSDWQLEKGAEIKQYVEEPLYKITIKVKNFSAKALETDAVEQLWTDESTQNIYVFYSQYNNQDEKL
jgi:hypothetical protein